MCLSTSPCQHQFVDPIAEGCDMLIRVGELKDSSLIARKLAEARRVVVATPGYWEKFGRPDKPEDLRTHNCLSYSYLSSGNSWRMTDTAGKEHVVQATGNLASNNGEALLEAAIEGFGGRQPANLDGGPGFGGRTSGRGTG